MRLLIIILLILVITLTPPRDNIPSLIISADSYRAQIDTSFLSGKTGDEKKEKVKNSLADRNISHIDVRFLGHAKKLKRK